MLLECGSLLPLWIAAARRRGTAMSHWSHAPIHRLTEAGAYIVTAGTYGKAHLFGSRERLTFLQDQMLSLAEYYGWALQAWAVFSNHYHFIAASENPDTLTRYVRHLHSLTARHVNAEDGQEGRKVWFQYWDTHLSIQSSYLARLSYVHLNPVKHGVVPVASQYPWGSARWFEASAPAALQQIVLSVKTDQMSVSDGFDVLRIF